MLARYHCHPKGQKLEKEITMTDETKLLAAATIMQGLLSSGDYTIRDGMGRPGLAHSYYMAGERAEELRHMLDVEHDTMLLINRLIIRCDSGEEESADPLQPLFPEPSEA